MNSLESKVDELTAILKDLFQKPERPKATKKELMADKFRESILKKSIKNKTKYYRQHNSEYSEKEKLA